MATFPLPLVDLLGHYGSFVVYALVGVLFGATLESAGDHSISTWSNGASTSSAAGNPVPVGAEHPSGTATPGCSGHHAVPDAESLNRPFPMNPA